MTDLGDDMKARLKETRLDMLHKSLNSLELEPETTHLQNFCRNLGQRQRRGGA